MRIFDLTIDGETYDAVCGLACLNRIQRKCGSLKNFEKKLMGSENDETDIDIALVIDTAVDFIESGCKATGKKVEKDIREIVNNASNMYGIITQLYEIYIKSMYPESDKNSEKN